MKNINKNKNTLYRSLKGKSEFKYKIKKSFVIEVYVMNEKRPLIKLRLFLSS